MSEQSPHREAPRQGDIPEKTETEKRVKIPTELGDLFIPEWVLPNVEKMGNKETRRIIGKGGYQMGFIICKKGRFKEGDIIQFPFQGEGLTTEKSEETTSVITGGMGQNEPLAVINLKGHHHKKGEELIFRVTGIEQKGGGVAAAKEKVFTLEVQQPGREIKELIVAELLSRYVLLDWLTWPVRKMMSPSVLFRWADPELMKNFDTNYKALMTLFAKKREGVKGEAEKKPTPEEIYEAKRKYYTEIWKGIRAYRENILANVKQERAQYTHDNQKDYEKNLRDFAKIMKDEKISLGSIAPFTMEEDLIRASRRELVDNRIWSEEELITYLNATTRQPAEKERAQHAKKEEIRTMCNNRLQAVQSAYEEKIRGQITEEDQKAYEKEIGDLIIFARKNSASDEEFELRYAGIIRDSRNALLRVGKWTKSRLDQFAAAQETATRDKQREAAELRKLIPGGGGKKQRGRRPRP